MSTPIAEHANGQPVDPARLLLADVTASGQPMVLRGLCRDWPVVQQARHSSGDFAKALVALDSGAPVDVLHMPPDADGVVGYNETLDGFNYRHFKVSLSEALTRLAGYSRVDGPVPGLAMQSALIAECMPGFLASHPMQLLPASAQPRLWVGNRVTTPAHFDASRNLAVVVCGRRRFTLFATAQVVNLYIGPLDFAPTGAAITLARPDQPDFERFPRLREALANAYTAELEPGDAIHMPPLWWHQVESLEPLNALVNYWWSPALPDGQRTGQGIDALLHARLALAKLPAASEPAGARCSTITCSTMVMLLHTFPRGSAGCSANSMWLRSPGCASASSQRCSRAPKFANQAPGPQSMQPFGGFGPMPNSFSRCRNALRRPSSMTG